MATSTKNKEKVISPTQFVTVDQFNKLTDVLGKVVDSIDELKKKTATPVEASAAKEVAKAGHDQAPLNPAWEEKTREIIGEAVDHCEIFYPKNGGQIFTVVIKRDLSNAPAEYLERMGADRRSKEIGNEGISGVEAWCKLIKSNLRRGK